MTVKHVKAATFLGDNAVDLTGSRWRTGSGSNTARWLGEQSFKTQITHGIDPWLRRQGIGEVTWINPHLMR